MKFCFVITETVISCAVENHLHFLTNLNTTKRFFSLYIYFCNKVVYELLVVVI